MDGTGFERLQAYLIAINGRRVYPCLANGTAAGRFAPYDLVTFHWYRNFAEAEQDWFNSQAEGVAGAECIRALKTEQAK